MVDLMPYHLEKGPPWSVVESIANESKTSLYTELEILRDTTKLLTDSRAFTSSSLNAGPTPTTALRIKHMLAHWFGMVQDAANGAWSAQPGCQRVASADTVVMAAPGTAEYSSYEHLISSWPTAYGEPPPKLLPATGWWINFHGEVEAVLREGLARAAELSLGLAHGDVLQDPEKAKRHWPVTIDMICPSPWFEVWVEWQGDVKKNGPGHVAVTVLTPAHPKGNVMTNPAGGRAIDVGSPGTELEFAL